MTLNYRPIPDYVGDLDLYEKLYRLYLNNGFYDDIAGVLNEDGKWGEAIRAFRNPTNRVIEFYANKMWAGTTDQCLPLSSENEQVTEAIEQIWQWSNLNLTKQKFTRWYSLFGVGYIRVAANDAQDRVYFQFLDPRWVTDFEADDRGFFQWIRIDIQREIDNPDSDEEKKLVWLTEYWTKDVYKRWDDHESGRTAKLSELGEPTVNQPNTLGFVPIAYAPFRDIGEKRGQGAVTATLEKIEEVDRQVTRLHQILFRYGKPIWAATQDLVKTGDNRPRPTRLTESGILDLQDDSLLALPAGVDIKSLIPNIPYDAMILEIDKQMQELQQDLPELKYYMINASAQTSGVALQIVLSDAIDRVIAARGNANGALIRANEIALTLAQQLKLEGYSSADIGTYDNGDFTHTIDQTDVIAPTATEKAAIATAMANTYKALKEAGIPTRVAAKRAGFTDKEVVEIEREETELTQESQAVTPTIQDDNQVDTEDTSDSPQSTR